MVSRKWFVACQKLKMIKGTTGPPGSSWTHQLLQDGSFLEFNDKEREIFANPSLMTESVAQPTPSKV